MTKKEEEGEVWPYMSLLLNYDIHVHLHSYKVVVLTACTLYCWGHTVIETRQIKATTPEDNSFFQEKKEELPQAGLEPATFCMLGRRSTK